MQAAILNVDGALDGQSALAARIGGARVEARALGPSLRLWARPSALDRLRALTREKLAAAMGPRLVFAGSGDFHHLTPMLLERALEAGEGPVTIVHVDNHPDWVRFDNGLHCGSWVRTAARLPGVAKLVSIGLCSADVAKADDQGGDPALLAEGRHVIYSWRAPDGAGEVTLSGRSRPTIVAIGVEAFKERLLAEIETRNVYVTIDKDALRPEDAATNWDQGAMSADALESILAAVLAKHRCIGADVVGDWSPPRYGGGLLAAAMKLGEARLDQPWRAPARPDAVNEPINLRLLDLFAEAA